MTTAGSAIIALSIALVVAGLILEHDKREIRLYPCITSVSEPTTREKILPEVAECEGFVTY